MAADNTQLKDRIQGLYAALSQVLEQANSQLVKGELKPKASSTFSSSNRAEREEQRLFLKKLLQSSKLGDEEQSMLRQRLTDLKSQLAFAGSITPPAFPLAGLPQANTASSIVVNAPLSTSFFQTNNSTELSAKYNELQHRFNALSSNFKLAKNALVRKKVQCEEWIDRALKLTKVIAAAEVRHGIKIVNMRSRSPSTVMNLAVDDGWNHDANNLLDRKPKGDEEEKIMSFGEDRKPGESTTLGKSESNQSEALNEQDVQLPKLSQKQSSSPVRDPAEPSSDTPMFLYERSVKKRRRVDSGPIERGPRLKVEPTDDSSVLSTIQSASDTQESLDLGNIEQKITTPRKPKDLAFLTPEYIEVDANPNAPYVSHLAIPILQHDQLQTQATHLKQPSVLTPLSMNVQRARLAMDKPKARTRRIDLGHAISVLAEDDCAYGFSTSDGKGQNSSTVTPLASGRLNTLNDPTLPANETIVSRPASRHRKLASAFSGQLPIPARRELPFDKGYVSVIRSGSPAKSRDRPSVHARNKATPASLRNKPLSELRLDDFKINRQANNGHDFAYAEVVRDRGERACLPGCTDEYCCGKQFRALAHSQRPDPPLTPAQRMEERRLLEEYLGDEAYRLGSMNGAEKAELWIEAKTQELANKYGKHRHRFSRMQSPPGFWNANFPDTQKLEADRAEAAKRERKAVAERHREALRPNGRWIFRDE